MKNIKLKLFVLFTVLFIITFIFPVNVGIKKLATIMFAGLTLISLFVLIGKRIKVQIVYCGFLLISVVLLMLNGHKIDGNTMRKEYVKTLKSYEGTDYSKVKAGDIAVTASGAHTIAYIGDRKWIEADPYRGKVVIISADDVKNVWVKKKFRVLMLSEFGTQDYLSYKVVYNEVYKENENIIKSLKNNVKKDTLASTYQMKTNKLYFTYIYSPKYTDAKVLINKDKIKINFYYSGRRRKSGVLLRISSNKNIKQSMCFEETDNRVKLYDNARTNVMQIKDKHILLPKGYFISDTNFVNIRKYGDTVLQGKKTTDWIKLLENSKIVNGNEVKNKIHSGVSVSFENLDYQSLFSVYTFRNNKEFLELQYPGEIKPVYLKSTELVSKLNKEAQWEKFDFGSLDKVTKIKFGNRKITKVITNKQKINNIISVLKTARDCEPYEMPFGSGGYIFIYTTNKIIECELVIDDASILIDGNEYFLKYEDFKRLKSIIKRTFQAYALIKNRDVFYK